MNSLRSWLFVPGDRPERYAKAAASASDAVIVDLEDSVAAECKSSARESVALWLAAGNTAWARINGDSGGRAEDLAALSGMPGVLGIVVPKVEHPEELAFVAQHCDVPILALVETAVGIENVSAIACAPGVLALGLGVIDLGFDVRLGDDPLAWAYARSRIVFASRAADLLAPIDGPAMSLDDPNSVRREAAQARDQGFGGKLCIHPNQVSVVNEVFRPSQKELEWARRAIDACPTGAATRVDGQMIDRPRVELARRILAESGTQAESTT